MSAHGITFGVISRPQDVPDDEQAVACGAIVDTAKALKVLKAGGKWNTYHIVAKGSKLTVTLNGTKTVDGADDARFAAGPIALQFGVGVVMFRKVQIRAL